MTWDDAAALMLRVDGISPLLFNEAVSYSLYVDLRMSTTVSRGFETPLEIIRGTVPDITKLRRFYTCLFVCILRQKCKQLSRKGYIGRAEVCRLMGFHSPFSSTYKVLLSQKLSQNRMVHNINVTFNDSNCAEQHALPSAPPQPRQLVDVRIEQAPSDTTEEDHCMGGLQHHCPHSHLQSQSPSQHSTPHFPQPSPVASMPPLGTPVGSHSQHSSQSTQFSQSPSRYDERPHPGLR